MRVAIALIVLSSCAAVQASEPVKSADGLESDLTACLMKSAKDGKCMETILGKSILPGNDEMVAVATQFHPEFTSTPRDGHPLFAGFVKAARQHRNAQLPEVASA